MILRVLRSDMIYDPCKYSPYSIIRDYERLRGWRISVDPIWLPENYFHYSVLNEVVDLDRNSNCTLCFKTSGLPRPS